MNPYISELLTQLHVTLHSEALQTTEPLERCRRSLAATQEAIMASKHHYRQHNFSDLAEEIHYFKEVQPTLFGYYFFYCRQLRILTSIPTSDTLRRKYYKKERTEIQAYFRQQRRWLQYMRSGATHSDHLYFTRSHPSLLEIEVEENTFALDEHLFAPGTYQFARLRAEEKMLQYIEQEGKADAGAVEPAAGGTGKSTSRPQLRWTGSKSDLIELLYALHSAKLFNNDDNMDVRQIATWLETTLHIDLGNYYRVFQGIRIRKKNRTQFLDRLRENLIQRMDDTDLNPRY